jgi:hypothetical protein
MSFFNDPDKRRLPSVVTMSRQPLHLFSRAALTSGYPLINAAPATSDDLLSRRA